VFSLDLSCRLPTINSEIKTHITAYFFLLFDVSVKKLYTKKNGENANLNLKVVTMYNMNIAGDEL